MRYLSLSFLLAMALFSFCGCSGKVPLQGRITFTDDDNPLPKGIVCFETDGYLARGHLKSDGSYRISSTGLDDGLPPGKYKVYLVDAFQVSESKNGNPVYTPLVDKRYESADSTDLEFEVDGKKKRFDIKVDRARKR